MKHDSWAHHLQTYSYNRIHTIHSTTKYKPIGLLTRGRKPYDEKDTATPKKLNDVKESIDENAIKGIHQNLKVTSMKWLIK